MACKTIIIGRFICYDFYKEKDNKNKIKLYMESFYVNFINFLRINSFKRNLLILSVFSLFALTLSLDVYADVIKDNLYGGDLYEKEIRFFSQCVNTFISKCNALSEKLHGYSYKLFFSLLFITILLNGFYLIINPGSIHSFMTVLIKILLINGTFLFFLNNSFYIAGTIVDTLTSMPGSFKVGPAEMLVKTLDIFNNALDNTKFEFLNMGYTFIYIIVEIIFFISMLFIVARFTAIYLSAYLLASIGCIFIALSSFEAFKNLAFNYFKHILAIGFELLVTLVIVNLGDDFINTVFQSAKGASFSLIISFILIFIAFVIIMLLHNTINITNRIISNLNLSSISAK